MVFLALNERTIEKQQWDRNEGSHISGIEQQKRMEAISASIWHHR
jgi:hypothetical protein